MCYAHLECTHFRSTVEVNDRRFRCERCVSSMSIQDLKLLIKDADLSFHLCIEKAELQAKAREALAVLARVAVLPSLSGEVLVGSRIKLWWDGDKKHFKGTVNSFNAKSGQHTVHYDDGERKDHVLEKEIWDLLDACLPLPKTQPGCWPRTANERGSSSSSQPVVIDIADCSEDDSEREYAAASVESKRGARAAKKRRTRQAAHEDDDFIVDDEEDEEDENYEEEESDDGGSGDDGDDDDDDNGGGCKDDNDDDDDDDDDDDEPPRHGGSSSSSGHQQQGRQTQGGTHLSCTQCGEKQPKDNFAPAQRRGVFGNYGSLRCLHCTLNQPRGTDAHVKNLERQASEQKEEDGEAEEETQQQADDRERKENGQPPRQQRRKPRRTTKRGSAPQSVEPSDESDGDWEEKSRAREREATRQRREEPRGRERDGRSEAPLRTGWAPGGGGKGGRGGGRGGG